MVAVEASLVLNEIATGERMTPGQNEAESRYVAAPCDTPMYLFQLDFWTEAFPRHWHEEWGIAVIHQGVNRFWFRGGVAQRWSGSDHRGTSRRGARRRAGQGQRVGRTDVATCRSIL